MAQERFAAVRHLAWRSLRRLVAPDVGPGQGFALGFGAWNGDLEVGE